MPSCDSTLTSIGVGEHLAGPGAVGAAARQHLRAQFNFKSTSSAAGITRVNQYIKGQAINQLLSPLTPHSTLTRATRSSYLVPYFVVRLG